MKRNKRRNTALVIRIILVVSVALFFCFNLFLKTTHALNGADVALYNDSIAPSGFQGVWQDGVALPREETMNDNGSDWELVKHILNWLMKKSNLPSCPSLYFWDGDEYVRKGSILAGAFYQEKEYWDHIPLSQLVPADGEYYLQIRETERERSFIDMAYLIVIDYISNNNDPASQNKDPGSAGSIIQHWILAPASATHSMIGDVSDELRYPDDQYVQMGIGEIITLSFPYLPEMGIQRDFIFIVEGFYIPTEKQ